MTAHVDTSLPGFLESYRVLKAHQAAEMLGISIATLRRLNAAGKIPSAIQLSQRRMGWRAGDLIQHLAKNGGAVSSER